MERLFCRYPRRTVGTEYEYGAKLSAKHNRDYLMKHSQ